MQKQRYGALLKASALIFILKNKHSVVFLMINEYYLDVNLIKSRNNGGMVCFVYFFVGMIAQESKG